jgi:HlyD family secretion protein
MTAITTLDDLGARRFPWCSTPAPLTPRSRLLALTWAGNLLVGCFVLGFGTWSTFAPLQSAAIAIGAVESESSRKTIQHLEGGIIREILVADGDVVRSGQTLISVDDNTARSEADSRQRQMWAATAREARLLAEQRGGAGFVSVERESGSRGRPCQAEGYLRNAAAGLSVAGRRHS